MIRYLLLLLVIVFQFYIGGILLPKIVSILSVIFTTIWYALMNNMVVINILSFIIIRPILYRFRVNGDNAVEASKFWTQIIKAPIATYFGCLILIHLFSDKAVIYPFLIGTLIWSYDFPFSGVYACDTYEFKGILKEQPYKKIMFICAAIGIIIGIIPFLF
jgi:hypothetical protein